MKDNMKLVFASILLGVSLLILDRKYLFLGEDWDFFILIYVFLLSGNEIVKLKKKENEKNV